MRTLALALVLSVPSLAAADVPAPPGYVEACTLANHQREGARCAECATWHSDQRRCPDRSELAGMTMCCRTRGASVWTEIWCEGGCAEEAPAAPAEPTREAATTPPEGGGCSASVPRASAPLGLIALALVRRRR